jgi:hypothetical protein
VDQSSDPSSISPDGDTPKSPDVEESRPPAGVPIESWPPRFTLDQEQVLNLFIGEGFYSSADASLREGILNSLDAVGRRQVFEPDLQRTILVTFDAEKLTVTIDPGDVAVERRLVH